MTMLFNSHAATEITHAWTGSKEPQRLQSMTMGRTCATSTSTSQP